MTAIAARTPRRTARGGPACPCCGSTAGRVSVPVLWDELSEAWGLAPEERAYIDRQQGERCPDCRSNLRAQALAVAVLRVAGHPGPFTAFARSFRGRRLRILEVNEAGQLTHLFPARCRRELRSYPELDMMAMRGVPSGRYDLVIHSDTLEHVPDPVRGLAECRRVLRPGGACCFTVPIVVGRLGRSRAGLPPSYHGTPGPAQDDLVVYTEYGADAWRQVLAAGFAECRVVAVEPPAAHALIGIK